MEIANPWVRVTAQIIDQGLVSFAVISALALWFPQSIGTPKWWTALILLWIFVSTCTQALFIWIYGNSPGKKSMGLVLQSARPQGGELSLSQIIVRSFTWWLGVFTLGSGWSTILSRHDRRAWHDVAADTVVVSIAGEPHRPTLTQSRIGDLWITLLSLTFCFFVVALLLLQLESLKRQTTSIGYQKFDSSSLMDQQSWLIVAGSALPNPDDILVGTDAKISKLLNLFSKARLLPLGERFNFYKVNMEEIEDEICRIGFEKTQNCESARLMVELLTPQPSLSLYTHAFQGLRALQQIEGLSRSADQLSYLEAEVKKMPVYSPQYFAFKSLESRVYLKRGDLKQAAEFVRNDLKALSEHEFKGSKVFMSAFVDSSCQALALQDGGFKDNSLCLQKQVWKDWQVGFHALTLPEKNSSSALVLGYWWAQVQSSKIKDQKFADWDLLRSQLSPKDNSLDSEFQRNVVVALDFVINVKLAPKDVLARERKMAPENPLWGWAQKQALQEFGTQWSFIIYPLEKKLLEKYSIIDSKVNRSIASDVEPAQKKPHLTTQLTIER